MTSPHPVDLLPLSSAFPAQQGGKLRLSPGLSGHSGDHREGPLSPQAELWWLPTENTGWSSPQASCALGLCVYGATVKFQFGDVCL